ncbi:MAG TPA: hypothetical protein VKA31_11260 [Mariprofundaceae bacterium]|nr:hypothetical protein [Mariprofundaceae bacterium]
MQNEKFVKAAVRDAFGKQWEIIPPNRAMVPHLTAQQIHIAVQEFLSEADRKAGKVLDPIDFQNTLTEPQVRRLLQMRRERLAVT